MRNGSVVRLETVYPQNGILKYTLANAGTLTTLAVRIPAWCTHFALRINGTSPETAEYRKQDGYLYMTRDWHTGDRCEITLDMPVVRVYPNPAVRKDAGCVAFQRGPVVYCAEEADNGTDLFTLVVPDQAVPEETEEEDPVLGHYIRLKVKGYREEKTKELYPILPPVRTEQDVKLLPYALWGNRGAGGMRVWIRRA